MTFATVMNSSTALGKSILRTGSTTFGNVMAESIHRVFTPSDFGRADLLLESAKTMPNGKMRTEQLQTSARIFRKIAIKQHGEWNYDLAAAAYSKCAEALESLGRKEDAVRASYLAGFFFGLDAKVNENSAITAIKNSNWHWAIELSGRQIRALVNQRKAFQKCVDSDAIEMGRLQSLSEPLLFIDRTQYKKIVGELMSEIEPKLLAAKERRDRINVEHLEGALTFKD